MIQRSKTNNVLDLIEAKSWNVYWLKPIFFFKKLVLEKTFMKKVRIFITTQLNFELQEISPLFWQAKNLAEEKQLQAGQWRTIKILFSTIRQVKWNVLLGRLLSHIQYAFLTFCLRKHLERRRCFLACFKISRLT